MPQRVRAGDIQGNRLTKFGYMPALLSETDDGTNHQHCWIDNRDVAAHHRDHEA
jgi:hypothetical protein